jgi:hypothetical protein
MSQAKTDLMAVREVMADREVLARWGANAAPCAILRLAMVGMAALEGRLAMAALEAMAGMGVDLRCTHRARPFLTTHLKVFTLMPQEARVGEAVLLANRVQEVFRVIMDITAP